jgi:dipeptidyl aminopeptidase/acylaminoacyl peptidase
VKSRQLRAAVETRVARCVPELRRGGDSASPRETLLASKQWHTIVLVFVLLLGSYAFAGDEPLQTVAEKSHYQATARHAEVVEFCERLAKQSPRVRLSELGKSSEGRSLPLLVLADPPVATPAEARASGKLVVFLMGGIHGGEVDGKEALLMLARDLAAEPALLKDLVVAIAPLTNPDGNDKFGPNRPKQKGPAEVGLRENAQKRDLNRDFVKLETPEVRAIVRFLRTWDPAVAIDFHTTNDSHHRHIVTYDAPRNPALDPKLRTFLWQDFLTDVAGRFEKLGRSTAPYGNFSADQRQWLPYPATPRHSTQYFGFRGRLGLLAEAFAYAPYQDRVVGSRDFARCCLETIAAKKDRIRELVRETKPAESIALKHRAVARKEPLTIRGFVEIPKDGKRVVTEEPKDYRLEFLGDSEATLTVRRPFAYLVPGELTQVIENLQRHGIALEELREDIELDVQTCDGAKPLTQAPSLSRERERVAAQRPGEGGMERTSVLLGDADPQQSTPPSPPAPLPHAGEGSQTRRVLAGTIVIRTAQPLGTLASYLLETQSEDGLAVAGLLESEKEPKAGPVLRLIQPVALLTIPARPLADDRQPPKTITYDDWYNGRVPSFWGGSAQVTGWLDDGEHFLQVKEGRLLKVHAATGRAEPLFDAKAFATAIEKLPSMKKDRAEAIARGGSFHMDPQRTGALLSHEHDLYFCSFDGQRSLRLTRTPQDEETPTFSPDGQWVAFVRDQNLYAVDLATQTERALTTDGGGPVFNGKADWVYFEEVFLRRYQAFWWSPDSTRIAFLRLDDTPVPKYTVSDLMPTRPRLEVTPYPKAGDPNPTVKLGIAAVAGGPVQWAERGNYSEDAMLILRAGWTPDSRQAFCYVQNRAQTWLDFCTVPRDGGPLHCLFRETTKAWVDDPGDPIFLRDGSFLLLSERTGWKQLYHFEPDGKLRRAVTEGAWELREVDGVDENAGWVYFTAAKPSPIAASFYRVRLDGSGLQQLAQAAGDHAVDLSPKRNLYVDRWSNRSTPGKTGLFAADGKPLRTLDTNPVYALDGYRLAQPEPLTIRTPDGFTLEASLLKPVDFDPARKYPVWYKTYGGPHMPTIHDNWQGGRVEDQALVQMGFLVFNCDPRSASGKGAQSTWTAYRQLGVQELKDVETAIGWLKSLPYVDSQRIGMSGHSYGGFLTAYCMTHSKLFAAGIAGAPVTDWRNYDTIYTERFMNTPQENPQGYDVSSVVKAAGNLHGRLLLIHGLIDDNVHVQNSIQLVQALQGANKDFELMIYPQARHGVGGKHYQRLLIDFMRRNLLEAEKK